MFRSIDFNSFRTILFVGLLVRLLASIFSQGYGMHDDHFLIIEAAASWVDGYDYNYWLPWTSGNKGSPEGHSFTYVGLNYLLIWLLKAIGFVDPKSIMLANRLVHALFSLLVVKYGFLITEKLSNRKNAVLVGWLLAVLWVWPFMSVRNLAEVACIPFLMWGTWLLVKHEFTSAEDRPDKWYNSPASIFFMSGFLLGSAVSFRFQVGVYAIGIASYFLLKARWKHFSVLCVGVLTSFSLTQGVVDFFLWGYPFAEFLGYVTYNMNEGTTYIPNSNYAMYFMVLSASFFPIGILFLVGFFRSYKKFLILFIPVLLFIVFHTLYPSKQERFILTVLPGFAILGVIGYESLLTRPFWAGAWKYCLRIFWVLCIPLLVAACFTYTKKSRVEAMYFIYENQLDPKMILFECTGNTGYSMPPRFYAQKWRFGLGERKSQDQPPNVEPDYKFDLIYFYDDDRIEERRAEYKEIYPKMTLGKICEPSYPDKLLRWINAETRTSSIEVWETNWKNGESIAKDS